MPRSGINSTYSLPPNTDNQVPNTPISSSMFNAAMDDIEQTFNTVQPEAYGGTGAATYAAARTNLGVVTEAVGAMNDRRDRIVNGDMRVSQENGTTPGTANGFYPVDQWAQYRVTSAGTLTVAQVSSVTPAGSPNRLRATVAVADASLAAGEYWVLTQNLEGSNVADFQWGSAAGKQVVLRFGFRGPAGTYAVSLQNYNGGTPNRSYVATFTISAGQADTDTVQTIAVPPSTSGTWLMADGVIGVTVNITLASGSTFQGTAGWNNSNVYGTSGVSNGMGTGAAVFELFDVGLKLDPDTTGVFGQYEVAKTDAVYRSERYWSSILASGRFYASAAGQYFSAPCDPPYPMAKVPTIAILFNGTIANLTSITFPVLGTSNRNARIELISFAAGDTFAIAAFVTFNARLS